MAMLAQARPYALDPGDGEAYWFFGCLVTLKAAGEQTGGRFALTEFVNPAGFASPLHVHHDEHEAFYILEGTAQVHCGDEAFSVAPGSFVLLPRGIPHWHQVSPDAPLRSLPRHVSCPRRLSRTWAARPPLASASGSMSSARPPRHRSHKANHNGSAPAVATRQPGAIHVAALLPTR
jgi:quercetin dioxygenase-like cupin family protein